MRARAFGLVLVLLCAAPASATHNADEHTPNARQLVRRVVKVNREPAQGTTMAFQGRRMVLGTNNMFADATASTEGFVVFRLLRRAPYVEKVSTYRCVTGSQVATDVTIWGDAVIQSVELGHPPRSQDNQSSRGCNNTDDSSAPVINEGIRIIDISNLSRPRQVRFLHVPCGSASHAVYPYKGRVYIYDANEACPESAPGDPGSQLNTMEMRIFRFDPKRPADTRLVAHPNMETMQGCDEISVFASRKLLACTGLDQIALFDLSDPTNPAMLDHEFVPDTVLLAESSFTWDGTRLLVGQANGTCEAQGPPYRQLIVFDIEDPRDMQEIGRFETPRTPAQRLGPEVIDPENEPVNPCAPVSVQVLPLREPNRHVAVIGYDRAGVSVMDFTDPSAAREIAYYMAKDPAQASNVHAKWYNGRIYAPEYFARSGLRVFRVDGTGRADTHFFSRRFNPSLQTSDFR